MSTAFLSDPTDSVEDLAVEFTHMDALVEINRGDDDVQVDSVAGSCICNNMTGSSTSKDMLDDRENHADTPTERTSGVERLLNKHRK